MRISSKYLLRRLTPVSRTKAWLSSAPDRGKRAQYAGFTRLRLTVTISPFGAHYKFELAENLCPSRPFTKNNARNQVSFQANL